MLDLDLGDSADISWGKNRVTILRRGTYSKHGHNDKFRETQIISTLPKRLMKLSAHDLGT